jgi:hypothetical protein
MLWFYTRDRDSLRLETRYDNQTLEYVGILSFRTASRTRSGSRRRGRSGTGWSQSTVI